MHAVSIATVVSALADVSTGKKETLRLPLCTFQRNWVESKTTINRVWFQVTPPTHTHIHHPFYSCSREQGLVIGAMNPEVELIVLCHSSLPMGNRALIQGLWFMPIWLAFCKRPWWHIFHLQIYFYRSMSGLVFPCWGCLWFHSRISVFRLTHWE